MLSLVNELDNNSPLTVITITMKCTSVIDYFSTNNNRSWKFQYMEVDNRARVVTWGVPVPIIDINDDWSAIN